MTHWGSAVCRAFSFIRKFTMTAFGTRVVEWCVEDYRSRHLVKGTASALEAYL